MRSRSPQSTRSRAWSTQSSSSWTPRPQRFPKNNRRYFRLAAREPCCRRRFRAWRLPDGRRAEEARLFYTAMTRAERYLYITACASHCPRRGRRACPRPSRSGLAHPEISDDPSRAAWPGFSAAMTAATPHRRDHRAHDLLGDPLLPPLPGGTIQIPEVDVGFSTADHRDVRVRQAPSTPPWASFTSPVQAPPRRAGRTTPSGSRGRGLPPEARSPRAATREPPGRPTRTGATARRRILRE